MQNKPIIVFFIILTAIAIPSNGQKQVNSPYSRFNIGTIEPSGSFRSMGMGGLSNAMRENSSVYFSNPASYSSIDTNSFIFDFGVDYSMSFLSAGTSKSSSDDMNFDHLLMGFPIKKGWGVATGIVSYSNGYYKLSEQVLETDPAYDPIIGTYNSYHFGEGGFNKFFLGTGSMIGKHLSAGVNMEILFGQIKRTNSFIFDGDYLNVYHNSSIENLQLSGVNLNYGIQYMTTFKKDYFLNLGLSYTASKKYNSSYSSLMSRYTVYGSGIFDTISYISDNTTKAIFPTTIGAGVSIGKKDKFTAGVDYNYTKWSEAVIYGGSGYMADSKDLRVGLEYIPDRFSNSSFVKRIEYRVGWHTSDNYLILGNNQLKEVGITFGTGILLRRTYSKTNLFFDYSKRSGPSGSNLPIENFYTMGISLNLYDYWFRKLRYD